MKMCVSYKAGMIMQMCVIWKDVLFEKVRYSKRCVIKNVCYPNGVLFY